MRFNQALASMSAEDFVQSILVDTLDAGEVVVGEDFKYGSRRLGDIETLRQAGHKLGFGLNAMPMLEVDGQLASSTAIRSHLASGKLDQAAHLLGRPYRMTGKVIRGKQLGRKLGYPTANIRLATLPSPLHGVFAIRARAGNGAWKEGVANLGTRPAVGGEGFLVEVHLFDYSDDLYGHRLDIEFVEKLRDEAHYENIDDLIAQMGEDERQARNCLTKSKF